MRTMTYLNGVSASNLINITLKEVNLTKKDQELPDAFVFNNKKHKTLIIYGTKIVLVPHLIFTQIGLYIEHVPP